MKTQIEKKLPAKGDRMEETEKLIKIASESLQEEKDMSDFMDMKYEEALKKFLKNNPGKTEQDFIDEAIIRIPMESGGKIIDFAKYAKSKDPKIKKLSLAELFTPGKTLAELTPQERETVYTLLKLTFGKKD